MIGPLLRINWITLKRDRVSLLLAYVLPIAFFSIFAIVFGGMAGGGGGGPAGPSGLKVLVVDEDGSELARRYIDALDAQDGVRVERDRAPETEGGAPRPWTRESATAAVRRGNAPAALIVPAEFERGFGTFQPDAPALELIYDGANPIAQFTVQGLAQAAAFQAAPDVLMQRGVDALDEFGGGLTVPQRAAINLILPQLRNQSFAALIDPVGAASPDDNDDGTEDDAASGTMQGLVTVTATAAQQQASDDGTTSKSVDIVSYYAAAIGVMFMLFSMAGAAGSLLEQEEFGTLDRLLTSRVTLTTLLLGNWLFFAALGVTQLIVMFLWGAFVFGVDLFTLPTLAGFIAMSVITAGAAAAFGILLATICTTRSQLSGLSTILILVMSALGGSMMPRFVAPFLETTSKFTFNGWALDGYQKVFWYREPDAGVGAVLASIVPQLALLVGVTVLFLVIARIAARRFER